MAGNAPCECSLKFVISNFVASYRPLIVGLHFWTATPIWRFPFFKKILLFSTFLLTLLDWTILSLFLSFFQAVSVREAVSATSCTWSPFRASFVANCTAASVEDAGKLSCHSNVKLWSWSFDIFCSNSPDRGGAARPKNFRFIQLHLLSLNQSLIHCVYRRMTKYSCQFPW